MMCKHDSCQLNATSKRRSKEQSSTKLHRGVRALSIIRWLRPTSCNGDLTSIFAKLYDMSAKENDTGGLLIIATYHPWLRYAITRWINMNRNRRLVYSVTWPQYQFSVSDTTIVRQSWGNRKKNYWYCWRWQWFRLWWESVIKSMAWCVFSHTVIHPVLIMTWSVSIVNRGWSGDNGTDSLKRVKISRWWLCSKLWLPEIIDKPLMPSCLHHSGTKLGHEENMSILVSYLLPY